MEYTNDIWHCFITLSAIIRENSMLGRKIAASVGLRINKDKTKMCESEDSQPTERYTGIMAVLVKWNLGSITGQDAETRLGS